MKVLVTGANGFIGQALCKSLLSCGVHTIAAIRTSHQFPVPIESRSVDSLSASTDWGRALEGVDVVIHLAARVHRMDIASPKVEAECMRVNVDGTSRLAEQAAIAGVKRFIFLSSIKVHGDECRVDEALTPSSPENPSDAYGWSKYQAELALESITGGLMETAIIRPPLVYGPGVRANFGSLINAVRRGIPLPFKGLTSNRRSFIGLGNLVSFIHHIALSPQLRAKKFLVSDGQDLSTAELVSRLALAMGRPARLYYLSPDLMSAAFFLINRRDAYHRLTGSLRIDMEEAIRTTGWSPPFCLDDSLMAAVSEVTS